MLNSTTIKVIGVATSIAGAGISMISSWVEDKKMDEKIDERIEKAFAEKENKKES